MLLFVFLSHRGKEEHSRCEIMLKTRWELMLKGSPHCIKIHVEGQLARPPRLIRADQPISIYMDEIVVK